MVSTRSSASRSVASVFLLLVVLGALLVSAVPTPGSDDVLELDYEEGSPDRRLMKRAAPTGVTPALPKYPYERGPHLSFLYFWAQRSGKLPYQRLAWRGDSCMDCKGPRGEDLSGGWYEATNTLKFALPFLHTMTMIAWNHMVHEQTLANINNKDESLAWIRHGAEYVFKSYPSKYEYVGMMGIADNVDFLYQGPPEEWTLGMHFSRSNGSFAMYLTKDKRSSEIVGQAAAAMALAAITLKASDPTYAAKCLQAAKDLYDFATTYPGSYAKWGLKDRVFATHADYYPTGSYIDELGLGAAFLYMATSETKYLDDAKKWWAQENARFKTDAGSLPQYFQTYDWENKLPALSLLLSQIDKDPNGIYGQEYRRNMNLWFKDCPASYGNCKVNPVVPAPEGTTLNLKCPCVYYTPGGLARGPNWGSFGAVSNMIFLALEHAKDLRKINAADAYALKLSNWAVKQMNYILGDNPGFPGRKKPFSYVVGFGKGSWPLRPNHISSYNSFIDFPMRGQSPDLIRFDFVVQGVTLKGNNYNTKKSNRFILYGGLVGGPTIKDVCVDDHWNSTYSEPTQDYTAGFLAATSALTELYGISRPTQSDCGLDLGWSHKNSSVAKRRKFAKGDVFHNCRTGLPYSIKHIG